MEMMMALLFSLFNAICWINFYFSGEVGLTSLNLPFLGLLANRYPLIVINYLFIVESDPNCTGSGTISMPR